MTPGHYSSLHRPNSLALYNAPWFQKVVDLDHLKYKVQPAINFGVLSELRMTTPKSVTSCRKKYSFIRKTNVLLPTCEVFHAKVTCEDKTMSTNKRAGRQTK